MLKESTIRTYLERVEYQLNTTPKDAISEGAIYRLEQEIKTIKWILEEK